MSIRKVPIIKRLSNLRIDVFGLEENIPLHISNREDKDIINLLLIGIEEGHLHYRYIRKFSRVLKDRTEHKCESVFIIIDVYTDLVEKIC